MKLQGEQIDVNKEYKNHTKFISVIRSHFHKFRSHDHNQVATAHEVYRKHKNCQQGKIVPSFKFFENEKLNQIQI
jgi:hypothetical protein